MEHPRTVVWAMTAGILLGGLSGCARHYWSKPGSTVDQFTRDSGECVREAGPTQADQQQAVVVDALYRACLTARGYTRDKQYDPPPPGSYRGIE